MGPLIRSPGARARLAYWLPIWHGPRRGVPGNWSLTVGHFCLNWETRYYRTSGLQVWWDDRMWMLWRTEVGWRT